jgi:hypothetical protein
MLILAEECQVRGSTNWSLSADFDSQFSDPAFDVLDAELDRIANTAWDAYAHSRKSPRTRKAGPEFANPAYGLAIDWIEAREAVKAAQDQHEDANSPNRILLINGSSRSEHTCPGEMSKSYRLANIAREVFANAGAEVQFLDLSRLASAHGCRVRPVVRPRRHCAIGRAPAIRIIRQDRRRD